MEGSQKISKQLVFFMTKAEFDACTDDVIKILLPTGRYCAHNLNFVNCFLNNTPPKEQKFILHWSKNRIPKKAVMQDVLEIRTVQLTEEFGEHEVNYLIPVPVLLEILGIPLSDLPRSLMEDEDRTRDQWETWEDMAAEREEAYNKILGRYCRKHGIAFHRIQQSLKKDNKYMREQRI